MKRGLVLAVAGLMLCVPAARAAKTPTTVTIDSAFYASGQTHWAGDIFSPSRACKDKRRVLIFRVRDGADQKMGSTRSFRGITDRKNYFWTYFQEGAAPKGRYYAKVRPTETCQGDRSGTERLG